MFKPAKALIPALICLVLAAGLCWLALVEAPAQENTAGERGRGWSAATLFVKGHYAYVADNTITSTWGDSAWVRIYDIEDPDNVGQCGSFYLASAACVFVAGDYLYVACYGGCTHKYDITDPCDPDLVATSCYSATWPSDMYVNDDRIFISYDPSGVYVYKDSTDTLVLLEAWSPGSGSPQGIQARGCYAYIANEGTNLWIRDFCEDDDYGVDTNYASIDVYNVGFINGVDAVSVTYEAATGRLRVWDTTDPSDISLVGSNNRGGTSRQVVHVTGDWVYRLGIGDSVEAYEVGYDDPDWHASYKGEGLLEDVHIVHERYIREQIKPIYGTAHILGIYREATPDPDTVAFWIHSPSSRTHRVDTYTYGDVDEDGDVDVSDVLRVNYYTVRGYNSVIENLDAADVNCDGEVNSCDYDYLADYLWNDGPEPGLDCDFYNEW